MPARSRLFLVVPKGADAAAIEVSLPGDTAPLLSSPAAGQTDTLCLLLQAHLASYRDLQYCKTDLIATKGVVFCKYAKSSSALAALEAITETGMVSFSCTSYQASALTLS